MATFSDLKFVLITTGDESGTWGATTNTNLGTAIEEAIVGSADITFASADVTLTLTDLNPATTQAARNFRLNLTGVSGGARILYLGSGCQIQKPYVIKNGLADAVTVRNYISGSGSGSSVTIPAGNTAWIFNTGADIVAATDYMPSLALGTALPLTSGGTGGTTAGTARTNLGATTLGSNLFTITNPSAITFPRFNADNSVSTLNAADFRTAIGAGTGTGTVTSVAMTVPTGLAVSGTPITASGTLALAMASGYSIPLNTSQTNWDTAYTERRQWDGGSTNLVAATGRTSLGATTLGGNLFTITNPNAITFPRFNADNTVSALSAADFRTAIGAGTGGGSVTGVTATSPVASSGGTAPDISLSAGYGDTLNPYASKTANFVLAAPNGGAGVPSFRAIVAADIPTLNQNTTGTAGGLSATLSVGSGGTGLTSWTSGTLPYNNGTTSFASSGFYYDGTNGGLAYAAEAWSGTWNAFRMGRTMYLAQDGGTTLGLGYVINGAYYNGSNWVRQYSSISPTSYRSGSGVHVFGYAPTGAAGSTFTNFADVATISSLGISLTTGNFVGNLSGNATTATSATSATSATTATSATKVSTTNFTIEESGGKLIFKYGGTTIASLTSAGVFTALSNVGSNGTP